MRQAQNAIQQIDHWISVDTYAQQSKIGNRAVHLRLKRKAIAFIRVDNWVVIDAKLSPPAKRLSYKQVAPPFVMPAGMPSYKNLIRISSFCEREGIRGHALFTAIALGHVPAWIFAGQVFIKDEPELKQYASHRRGKA